MNLNELFENLSVNQHAITNDHRYAMADELTDEQIQQQITRWLSGLDTHHQVPGKTVGVMLGICDMSLNHIPLSHKQRIYAVSNLIRYWDQMSVQARADMML
jgi:hypothetical protein